MGFFGLLLKRTATATAVSVPAGFGAWTLYSHHTHHTHFVPFASYPDSYSLKKLNPQSKPPACIDHAIRRVPAPQLRTTDQEELTKEFCRGVWSGWGFAYQRRFLEKKYRALPERATQLWERPDLARSEYAAGTVITDHFEVVERTPERVVVRCGDSPLKRELRPSDGIFEMEVTKEGADVVFHMKSVFFNSTPEGRTPAQLPWWFSWAHQQYTKLWMETSVRKLLK